MTIVRRLARPLLAAPLIAAGVNAFNHPGPQTEAAAPVLGPITDRLGAPLGLPHDQELLVRVGGGLTVAAGALLAIGRLPRLSALAILLAAPAVQSGPAFWLEKDPQQRQAQQAAFLKNVGLIGGTLIAAVDTAGRPGLGYRARRDAREARRAAKLVRLGAKAATRGKVSLPTG